LNWSRKKVIVTGGAGFIGGTIVDKLLGQGASVTVVDKLLFPNKANIGGAKLKRLAAIYRKHGIDEVPIETIDLSLNPRDFELLARKHDIVFHLSAVFGGREFVDIHQVECSKMLAIDHNVISSSYEAGIQHLHYASSACVYAPSLNRPDVLLREDHILSTGEGWQSSDNLYGFAKLMGEMQLNVFNKEKGFQSSISRYLTVYGPGELDASHAIAALIEKALDRQDPYVVWGSGEQERGFTYVDDIAAGSMLAVEHITDATAVNLGWDTRYKIKDVARMILEISGHRPTSVHFDRSKPEGPFSRALDISCAKNLLLWHPKVSLEEGLERTISWHMQERGMALTPQIQA
jgi:nucleoside-diphosphate-sugar epimerase